MNTTTSKTQPVVAGALVMGVLSALPLIKYGNACCCLWVICGGLVAAYLLQENQAAPITAADGALVGLLAGLLGAVIALVVSIPFEILAAPFQRRVIERLIATGQLSPQFEQFALSSVATVAGMVFGFIIMLFAGVVFSTLGGLLGAALFHKPAPPMAPPPPPPPPGPIDIPPIDIPPTS